MDLSQTASPITGIAPTEPTENRLEPITIDDLTPGLRSAVDGAGWTKLMPVQSKAMPYILNGQDVMVQSRTGSGKTGGFILPTLDRIDTSRKTCQALVLVPTRELANQVANEARMLSKGSDIQIVAVYGGVAYGPQRAAFNKGAHLVVGTPGRVLDHLQGGTFSLEDLQMFVMDEADRMLSVGFYPDMKAVQSHLPKRRVNMCMFSATFPPHVLRLAHEFQHEPVVLSLSSDHVHVTNVEHNVYHLDNRTHKDDILLRLIEIENPNQAIIFCNTKSKVNYVAVVLQRSGYNADQLSGDLTQVAREKVLNRVRDGKIRFLIATDVAARGIDIPELSHVIQFDVPQHPETYIHRAGRTGRAGASGTALMLVELLDRLNFGRIEKEYDIDMQATPIPTREEMLDVVEQRARASVRARYRQQDEARREIIDRYDDMVELLTMNADGLRAMAMLLDDFYQNEVSNAEPILAPDVETPEVDEKVMGEIAQALMSEMESRDKLRLERMTRFVPLVESLSMSGQGFHALSLLLHNYHQWITAEPPKKKKARPARNRDSGGNRNSRGNSCGNSRGRSRRR